MANIIEEGKNSTNTETRNIGIFDYGLILVLLLSNEDRVLSSTQSDRFFLSFHFSMRVGPGPNLKTSIIEKRTNNRRSIINLLAAKSLIKHPFLEKLIEKYKFRGPISKNYDHSPNIHSLPFDMERRRKNVYISAYSKFDHQANNIAYWIPRAYIRKASPLIRVTHRNTSKFNLSGVSARRDERARHVHVTPNNKVARFSSGWIAVNIVDGH